MKAFGYSLENPRPGNVEAWFYFVLDNAIVEYLYIRSGTSTFYMYNKAIKNRSSMKGALLTCFGINGDPTVMLGGDLWKIII